MGRQGLRHAAELSYASAHYLCDQLLALPGFRLKYDQPFFNEFCVTYDGDLDALMQECTEAGFMAGVKVDPHTLMLAVTEQRTRDEIDDLVLTIKQFGEDMA